MSREGSHRAPEEATPKESAPTNRDRRVAECERCPVIHREIQTPTGRSGRSRTKIELTGLRRTAGEIHDRVETTTIAKTRCLPSPAVFRTDDSRSDRATSRKRCRSLQSHEGTGARGNPRSSEPENDGTRDCRGHDPGGVRAEDVSGGARLGTQSPFRPRPDEAVPDRPEEGGKVLATAFEMQGQPLPVTRRSSRLHPL